ncbi:unnamed protein product [Rodentolepis nana]|uniref:Abasic site processing protein HMCES n=1 Tax=Rodentolepis nana TaxID=102285 RepID=A0A0R3T2C6_RODNA|nr:unnamed protein product [Rodentolepis nana]
MRWGLIPSFVPNALEKASSYKFATSNARAENILERPSYMDCIKHRRRCVVIAQGFYEWKQENGKKMPYYISIPGQDESLMLMAGIFSVNKEQTVIFRDPEDIFEWITPNLCSPTQVGYCDDPTCILVFQTVSYLQHLTDKLKAIELRIYPVTPLMNSTSFSSHQCVEPLDPFKPYFHFENFRNQILHIIESLRIFLKPRR